MTMVELLVALVILSIVASMSASSLRWQAAKSVADARAGMRTAAIRSGREVATCDSAGTCMVFLPDGRVVAGKPAGTAGGS